MYDAYISLRQNLALANVEIVAWLSRSELQPVLNGISLSVSRAQGRTGFELINRSREAMHFTIAAIASMQAAVVLPVTSHPLFISTANSHSNLSGI